MTTQVPRPRKILPQPNPEYEDPASFHKLPVPEQERLVNWIRMKFAPARCLRSRTFSIWNPTTDQWYYWSPCSMGLKHWFSYETGEYVSNGQFKGGMVAAGYPPARGDLTPLYRIRLRVKPPKPPRPKRRYSRYRWR
jgi:hypothetical protein